LDNKSATARDSTRKALFIVDSFTNMKISDNKSAMTRDSTQKAQFIVDSFTQKGILDNKSATARDSTRKALLIVDSFTKMKISDNKSAMTRRFASCDSRNSDFTSAGMRKAPSYGVSRSGGRATWNRRDASPR
jgi:KaiC/GvpD/RAD55 family RecA-like ATPase